MIAGWFFFVLIFDDYGLLEFFDVNPFAPKPTFLLMNFETVPEEEPRSESESYEEANQNAKGLWVERKTTFKQTPKPWVFDCVNQYAVFDTEFWPIYPAGQTFCEISAERTDVASKTLLFHLLHLLAGGPKWIWDLCNILFHAKRWWGFWQGGGHFFVGWLLHPLDPSTECRSIDFFQDSSSETSETTTPGTSTGARCIQGHDLKTGSHGSDSEGQRSPRKPIFAHVIQEDAIWWAVGRRTW